MAQAKAASEALQVAFTQFKQAKTLLSKSLKAASKNERTLTSKMSSLSDALSEINRCHTYGLQNLASLKKITEEPPLIR